ncbi:hypothetical protein IJI17_01510 [Candidatus Saccharibacteria bacterium]|nr:hypothetical protein [Candidatus Saccharibacteria bacterium]
MKVIKSSLLALFSLLFVALSTTSVSALSSSRKREYGYNGIFFYDPDWVAKASSCDSFIITDLSGNSNAEKAWNFLLNADIPGVSNNPAAIAGIIGNLMAESNVNPFARNSIGCSGIYQACGGRNTALLNELASHGITWGDESQSDAALQIELTYMINEPGEFTQYTNNLNRVANQSPSSYAELFLVVYERAVYGTDQILDSGVASLAGNNLYQNASGRRNFAESAYSSFSSLSASTPLSDSSEDSTSPTPQTSSRPASTCGVSTTGNFIADTAISLAWEENHITAGMEHTTAGTSNPRPEYVSAMQSVGTYIDPCNASGCAPKGASCDQFASTVVRYSGADTNFPVFGPNSQASYMTSNPLFQRITEAENNNYSALMPGDILVNSDPQHIYIYVEINGQPKIAEAGFNRVTGEITAFYTMPGYQVYRYVGATK